MLFIDVQAADTVISVPIGCSNVNRGILARHKTIISLELVVSRSFCSIRVDGAGYRVETLGAADILYGIDPIQLVALGGASQRPTCLRFLGSLVRSINTVLHFI